MPNVFRIALLGFSDFERKTLASCFRLAANRNPRYDLVQMLTDADYLVADADHAPSVQLVVATERLAESVFIGARAPLGATAWTSRPIDPMHVMRELDSIVAGTGVALPPAMAPLLPAGPEGPGAAAPETAVDVGQDIGLGAAPAPTPTTTPVPRSPAAAAARRQRPAALPAAALAPATPPAPPPPPRALLVDDSEIALRFLESRLERWGMVTDRAATSSKAIELLARRDYDFVFLDMELGPGSDMDGLALCQHIKRNQSAGAAIGSSVFIVSAHQTELDRVRGSLAGCDAYLGKPLQEVDLQRLLLRHGLKPQPAVRDTAPPP
jgi:CheY-like chemotaxis protein